jgi:hypothetical protein
VILPDPVPIGVSGTVTIARDEYLERFVDKVEGKDILTDDRQRIAYLAHRLIGALDRPLTGPGSEGLAHLILGHFEKMDPLSHFAEKVLESLRDGNAHDRALVSPGKPRVAVWFVAWNGTHREVQSERFGRYLNSIAATGRLLVERGIEIVGLLEIDAYVRENVDLNQIGRSFDDIFEIDIEYSYIPGDLLGSSAKAPGQLYKVMMLNAELCSPDERQTLEKLTGPRR